MSIPTLQDYRWYTICLATNQDIPPYPLQPYTIRNVQKTITNETTPSLSLSVGRLVLDRVFSLYLLESHGSSKCILIPSNLASKPSAPENNDRDPTRPEPPAISMAYEDHPVYDNHKLLIDTLRQMGILAPTKPVIQRSPFYQPPFQTYDSPHFLQPEELIALADFVQSQTPL